MKKCFLIPVMLITMTSCGTVQRLNCMIEQSTESIHANREAIESSTYVIQRNAQLIDESSKAIEENRRHLEAVSSGT